MKNVLIHEYNNKSLEVDLILKAFLSRKRGHFQHTKGITYNWIWKTENVKTYRVSVNDLINSTSTLGLWTTLFLHRVNHRIINSIWSLWQGFITCISVMLILLMSTLRQKHWFIHSCISAPAPLLSISIS